MQASRSELEKKLLALVQEFIAELETNHSYRVVTLDASLDRDLGIGSLERAELFRRIEQAFAINLSDTTLAKTNTLQDLIAELQQTKPSILTQTFIYSPETTLTATKVNVSATTTLLEVLHLYAKNEPQRPHIYLLDEQGGEKIIRYGELLENSQAIARGLHARGLPHRGTVAIMLPTCEEFFSSFFGVLLAGGIPVPIYPPFRPDQIADYAKREAKILQNAEVRFLITFHRAETLSKILQSFIPSLKEVVTAANLMTSKGSLPTFDLQGEDPAFIQYTSGSTSDPKGVLLSHDNLLANLRAVGQAINISPNDRVVSWLPLYHDMGLIGAWLGSLYFGIPATILSPLFFLNRPERWLWAIHYYRATLSAGPNFAYELCARRIKDESIQGLDLSSWRLALNGAETVYAKTIRRFTKKYAPFGFKAETLFPVYGLAESSVALSFPPLGRVPRIDKVIRESLENERHAIPALATTKHWLEFVSCGKAIPGHAIRIVDDDNQNLTERLVGNVQFQGPSSMQGYYRNPVATQTVHHHGWWDTGDLGYCADGELFITGRKKDVIIKAGRNLYAAELEDLAAEVTGVRKGCVVAFAVSEPKSGTEKLVIVAETNEKKSTLHGQIKAQITDKITETIGIPPDQIILVPPKTIPKTSSGKLRRASCKERYLQGNLTKKMSPAWLQVTGLFLISSFKKINHALGQLGKVFYTLYVAVLVTIILLLLWPFVVLLPQRTSTKLCHFWARNLFRFAGCPISIKGLENLQQYPLILVANHSSYVDAFLLTAIMPIGMVFVAKQELFRVPVIGTFLKKLGHLGVDRLDFSQSLSDMQLVAETLQKGHSILIFPEGTFSYAAGLRPFKLGAFKVAVDTGVALCPIALCGTRNILRDGSWLLKPGTIKVTILEPITAKDNDWSEMIRLRTITRNEIAKSCGEPTIDFT